ncbi:hypothetical protein PUN28_013281 [Cardiocondyla obscurior]|uniref:Uncharacterized protein n=1 Tax=Cardiocondyla obscurior TaxID=286306 RepID=A0AAW2FCL8_9HYME
MCRGVFYNYPEVGFTGYIPERSIALQSSEEEDWEGEMQLQLQTQRNIKDIPQRERTWQYYSTNHFVTWDQCEDESERKPVTLTGGLRGGGGPGRVSCTSGATPEIDAVVSTAVNESVVTADD